MIGSVSVRFNQSISSHPLLGYYLKPPAVYLHGRKIPRVRNFHTRSWHFVCFICVSSVKGRLCGALSFLSVCSSKYSRVLVTRLIAFLLGGKLVINRSWWSHAFNNLLVLKMDQIALLFICTYFKVRPYVKSWTYWLVKPFCLSGYWFFLGLSRRRNTFYDKLSFSINHIRLLFICANL